MNNIRSHLDIFRDALKFIQDEDSSPAFELNDYQDDYGRYLCCNKTQECGTKERYVHINECYWLKLIRELKAFINVEEDTGHFFGKEVS